MSGDIGVSLRQSGGWRLLWILPWYRQIEFGWRSRHPQSPGKESIHCRLWHQKTHSVELTIQKAVVS
jgi:hypothetical protein